MDQTFMTIHNLSPEANILFASESIADILGYQPAEVQGKSCFDYFHPDEVPFARSVHSRGVLLDKAAVLHYARVLSRDGRWIGCECCFTIVHDVLVACTSIYRRSAKSERRAIEAPQIRRIFSCSPRDPRYHMLEHLSPKFKMPPMEREPRAALILNRFTRNLTVMFATTSITSVLGLRPNEIKNRGFYRCIQENCLTEAIECLESAKANDSIAYLRFFFKDPREDDELASAAVNNSSSGSSNETNEEGSEMSGIENTGRQRREILHPDSLADAEIGESSMVDIKIEEDDTHVSMPAVPLVSQTALITPPSRLPSIELEAVVSCTSDGLVVILRKARPPIPPAHPPLVALNYRDGLFAAPWGQQPIRPHFSQESLHTFRPPLLPQYMPLRDNVKDAGGPPLDVLMGSIRDVAVFAWGVVGINPAMAAYGRGLPSGEARPPSNVRQNYQQTRHEGDDGPSIDINNNAMPSSMHRNKGKAPEVAASAFHSHGNPSRRPRSYASYNALDPIIRDTSSRPCGLQSAFPSSTDLSWGSARYQPGPSELSPRSGGARVQQNSNSSSYPASNTSASRLPSIFRGVACQSPIYSPPASQVTPPNTSGSFRDHNYAWR